MSICSDCASLKRDCCHLRGNPSHKFGLTASDLARITKATGKQPQEYSVTENVAKYVQKDMESALPGIGRMFPNGVRTALRFDGTDGACHFLGEAGCTLDMNTRPRFCALYPTWYVGTRVRTGALASAGRCMAVRDAGGSDTRLYRLLGTTRAQVEHLARVSNRELGGC